MSNLIKTHIICLITMLFLQTTYAAQFPKNLFDFYTNKAKIAATTIEVKNIAQMIYLDYIAGIEIPTPDMFSDYIRKHNRPPYGHKRDTAVDFWNNFYLLINDQAGFKVVSIGPDGLVHTDDDVVYGFYLE